MESVEFSIVCGSCLPGRELMPALWSLSNSPLLWRWDIFYRDSNEIIEQAKQYKVFWTVGGAKKYFMWIQSSKAGPLKSNVNLLEAIQNSWKITNELPSLAVNSHINPFSFGANKKRDWGGLLCLTAWAEIWVFYLRYMTTSKNGKEAKSSCWLQI